MTPARRSALIAICAVGLVGQVVVPFFILLTWARVYFTFGGPAPVPTSNQILGAGLLSGISIAASIVLIVVAQLAHVRGLVIAHSILLVVIVACAILFAVPRLDFTRPDTHNPVPSNSGTPCYSGSNKCN